MTRSQPRLKVVVVGDAVVGKTTLLNHFTTGEYHIDEFCRPRFLGQAAPIEVDKKKYDLTLWNTANHEDYTRIRHLVYMNVDVLLICFAVDDPESFSNAIDKWKVEVKEYCPSVPIILVGCKGDTRTDKRALDILKLRGQACVPANTAHSASKSIGATNYVECSARNCQNVSELFQTATRAAVAAQASQKRKHIKKKRSESGCTVL